MENVSLFIIIIIYHNIIDNKQKMSVFSRFSSSDNHKHKHTHKYSLVKKKKLSFFFVYENKIIKR